MIHTYIVNRAMGNLKVGQEVIHDDDWPMSSEATQSKLNSGNNHIDICARLPGTNGMTFYPRYALSTLDGKPLEAQKMKEEKPKDTDKSRYIFPVRKEGVTNSKVFYVDTNEWEIAGHYGMIGYSENYDGSVHGYLQKGEHIGTAQASNVPAPQAPQAPHDYITDGLRPAPAAPWPNIPPAAPAPSKPGPDFKGHTSLADMMNNHIPHWIKAIETIAAMRYAMGDKDDASFWQHEFKALEDIQTATQLVWEQEQQPKPPVYSTDEYVKLSNEKSKVIDSLAIAKDNHKLDMDALHKIAGILSERGYTAK